jgi:molybdate transport system ATP-binding protein
LLLDEPLSAIDSDKKSEVLPWLEQVREELKISMVYVTHSSQELLGLAQSVAVMKEGRISQKGPLETIFPVLAPSQMIEQTAEVEFEFQARVSKVDELLQLMRLDFSGGSIWVKRENFDLNLPLIIKVLAQEVLVSTEVAAASSELNTFEGAVTNILDMPHPSEKLIQLSSGGAHFLSITSTKAVNQLALKRQMKVWIQIRSVKKLIKFDGK